jgi:predicted metal-dependent hydrolase
MHVRAPDIAPEEGPLIWSKVPEFCIAYNGYSVVIPYVEYYLNAVMSRVRREYGSQDEALRRDLGVFLKQEANHSKYHVRFNQRMFDAGIEGLEALVDEFAAELKMQFETKPLAFNVAYCAGFESIATYDSTYIYERCDRYFEGADSHGANLLLWHVAEEFEHRCVCHDAFHAVSGRYLTRIHGLLWAFWHVGGAFIRAENLVLAHCIRDLSAREKRRSVRRSKRLFWRQIAFVAPRMLKIFLPGYYPGRLRLPRRMRVALEIFRSDGPITERVPLG